MPIFKIQSITLQNGPVQLAPGDLHHMKRVLRIKPGDAIQLGDQVGNLYKATVKEIQKQLVIENIKKIASPAPPYPVTLVLSLLKKEKMEFLVEKAVELNIHGIQFMRSSHSVRNDISPNHWIRLQKIATGAGKQCGRLIPLVLEPVITFKIALDNMNQGTVFFCSEDRTKPELKKLLVNKLQPPYSVWIGPEGGWAENEIAMIADKNCPMVSIAPLILRSETAALHAISTVLNYL